MAMQMDARTTNWVGVLAVFIALAWLAWVIWSGWLRNEELRAQTNTSMEAGVAPVPVAVAAKYRIDDIVAAHLFGTAAATPDNTVTEAPQTRLQLKLLGVVASDDEQFARALIGLASEPPKSYAVGQEIGKTDARLHAVEEHRVLLDRAGRMESLVLERLRLQASSSKTEL
jgi:general secretion pathway protein C